ncbi:MAG: hypothetical protein R3D85_07120 [Paracoccaceae bacterium]
MPVYVSDYTAIISGDSWSGELGTPTVVTYSFETEVQPEVAGLYSQAFADSFGPMSAGLRALARQAFEIWADACGLVFVEVPAGEGDIRLGMFNFSLSSSVSGFTGFAYHPQRVVYDYALYEWPVGATSSSTAPARAISTSI